MPDSKPPADPAAPAAAPAAPPAADPPAAAPAAPAATPEPAAAPLADALRQASEGLLLPSESDAPFTLETLPQAPTPGFLRQASGAEAGAPVEWVELADLFAPLTIERASHGDEEKAEIARFHGLHRLLSERLKGAAVYRVGKVDVTVWIVGQDEQGAWLALRSSLVET